MDLKINGWIASAVTAFAATVGIGTLALKDPDEGRDKVVVKDPRFNQTTGTIYLKEKGLSSFASSASASESTPSKETFLPSPGSAASAPEISADELDTRIAKSYFRKFQRETLSGSKRFDDIIYAYKYLGKDMNKAGELGISPSELAGHLRNSAYQALLEQQAQAPQTNLEKFLQAKEMMWAISYMQIRDDGSFDDTQQIAGIDVDSLRQYQYDMVESAFNEARTLLSTIPSLSSLSGDELSRYWDMLDLSIYAIEHSSLSRADREEAGMGRQDRQRYQNLLTDIENEKASRLKNEVTEAALQPAPSAPKP